MTESQRCGRRQNKTRNSCIKMAWYGFRARRFQYMISVDKQSDGFSARFHSYSAPLFLRWVLIYPHSLPSPFAGVPLLQGVWKELSRKYLAMKFKLSIFSSHFLLSYSIFSFSTLDRVKFINAIRSGCMISVETGRRGFARFLSQHVMMLWTFKSTKIYKSALLDPSG